MEKTTLQTNLTPEVTIERVDGNLYVRGWDSSTTVIQTPSGQLELEEQEEGFCLVCSENCDIHLPKGAILKVENVAGNAGFKNLDETLVIGEVHGSLSLRNMAAAQVEAVHGELGAKYLEGDLRVERVHGNAAIREIQGACVLEEVDGNIDLRDVEDDIQATVQGNARLRLNAMLGSAYRLQAAGNVHCHIPTNVDLKISLTSAAQAIKLRLPEESKNLQQESYQLALGEGQASLEITAGGVIYLVGEDGWEQESFEFDVDLNHQITQQVEVQIQAQMESMMQEINEQMAQISERVSQAGLSTQETERIMEQARQVSERESGRAQERMRRAQEKLERKLEAAQRKQALKTQASQRRTRLTWDFNTPTKPAQARTPVSEEERLAILRMLEQKKISLEQAEQLLAALEGKD